MMVPDRTPLTMSLGIILINNSMYYLLYETRNKINGKIYVGCHETKDINDGYLGSGTRIRYAIEKYGRENFERTILMSFNNAKDMYAAEAEVVNEKFVAKDTTYNLKEGGRGGWKDAQKLPDYMDRVKAGIARYYENNPGHSGFKNKTHDNETRKRISESQLGEKNHFYGKKHTKHTKQKMAEHGKRPLSIGGVKYNSRTDAAAAHDVSVMTIHRWLKSNKAQSI